MINRFILDKKTTFLNHGSFGACTKEVMNQYIEFQYRLENQPVHFIEKEIPDLMTKSRKSLSTFLNVDSNDLILIDNPTTAINEIIRSLKLQPGDEIISTDHEYGAMDKAWEFVTEKTGSIYKNIKLPFPIESDKDITSTLINNCSDKTKVLFISHITSPTAIIFPVKELCDFARKNNIITIIDGAHAPGHIELDIMNLNPDYYIGTCHKWLCTPKGVSFLYVNKEMQNKLDPLIIGWGWRDSETKLSNFQSNHQWWGTRDMSSYFCIPLSIMIHQEKEMINSRIKCLSRIPSIRKEINYITKQQDLCPNKMLGHMASMIIPIENHVEIKNKLINDYNIEIPIFNWKGKNLLRVSYYLYNQKKDINYLIKALKEILS
tara:strand:- start:356 stop:1486 length:1131 start_codon:yes stop_codon:yes gene_type:complete